MLGFVVLTIIWKKHKIWLKETHFSKSGKLSRICEVKKTERDKSILIMKKK